MVFFIAPVGFTKAYSQQVDSLKQLENFLQLCYAYKKPVMHIGIDYKVTTNLEAQAEDTATQEAEFYILPQRAYMRFGEIEQVVSDTVALVISKKLKRVMVFSNPQPIISQINSNIGIAIPQGSIAEMAKVYTTKEEQEQGDTGVLTLETRARVYGGDLPKESIAIRYSVKTNRLYAVVNTKRQSVPVERNEYLHLRLKPTIQDKAFENTEGTFVIRELTALYRFRTMEYEGVVLPVGIHDRVMKNLTGMYTPVGPCKGYRLSEE